MAEKLMIIVTGAPAAGKTTLSKNLAERFNMPLINKDEVKELLFDNLGIKDEEWTIKLGIASFELIYFFVEKLAQTGKTFIVEGNFDNKYATRTFEEIKSRYNYKILQIFCHAQEEILYERFINRNKSGNRHPGHIRPISGFEEYRRLINNRNYKLDIDCSINIDTTRFEDVNLKQVYDEVEKNINSCT